MLEAAARLHYREWFVHFRFPGHEQVKISEDLPKLSGQECRLSEADSKFDTTENWWHAKR